MIIFIYILSLDQKAKVNQKYSSFSYADCMILLSSFAFYFLNKICYMSMIKKSFCTFKK